jgi:hypothetical protein
MNVLMHLMHRIIPTGVGKDVDQSEAVAPRRFIPTYVGKSRPGGLATRCRTVHPHVCGEKFASSMKIWPKSGSSPRTWGKGSAVSRNPAGRRFIPTGVGKSIPTREPRSCGTVHPHGRGEKKEYPCAACGRVGSSPRAWGKERISLRGLW